MPRLNLINPNTNQNTPPANNTSPPANTNSGDGDYGLWLLIAAGIHFLLRFGVNFGGIYGTISNWYVASDLFIIFSIGLFLFAAIAVFHKRVGIASVMFLVGFWWIETTNATLWKTGLAMVASIAAGFIAHLIIDFWQKKRRSNAGEEVWAVLPIIIFLLDFGIVDYLDKFGYSDWVLAGWIASIPFWMIVGFATAKRASGKGTWIIKGIGIAIPVVMILGVIISASFLDTGDGGTGLGKVDGLSAINKARQEAAKNAKPNAVVINAKCMYITSLGAKGDMKECFDKEYLNKEVEIYCKNTEKKTEKAELEQCRTEQLRQRSVKKVSFSGSVYRTSKPTTAKFEYSSRSSTKVLLNQDGTLSVFPFAKLNVQNPNGQAMEVEFSCHFMKGKAKTKGIIDGEKKVTTKGLTQSIPVFCQPPNKKLAKGSYSVVFEAKISNLETQTILERVFTPSSQKWLEENQQRIKRAYGNGKPQHPADLVYLDFVFGKNPTDLIFPVDDKGGALVYTITKNSACKKVEVKSFEIGLQDFEFKDRSCLSGSNVKVRKGSSRDIYNGGCFIKGVPDKYKSLTDEEVRDSFVAKINYNCVIEGKRTLRVDTLYDEKKLTS